MVKTNMAAMAAALLCALFVMACADDLSVTPTPSTDGATTSLTCNTEADCFDSKNPCGPVRTCEVKLNAQAELVGTCKVVMGAQHKGTPCNDSNACTSNEACDGNGACIASAAKISCDDGNGCTSDSCDQKTGCAHLPLQVSCTDGDACTSGDKCEGVVCKGQKADCDDSNACTTDSCNPKSGCVHTTNSNPCEDGNVCTLGDACQNGACAPGTKQKVCDDGNGCTVDVCDGQLGCKAPAKADGTVCSDADPTTGNDVCMTGVCKGKPIFSCESDNDCVKWIKTMCGTPLCSLDDGAKPTDSKTCKVDATVDPDDGNPCTLDSCDFTKGVVHKPLSGNVCDDGEVCTVGDSCLTGVCVPGKPQNCDDGNACTDEACVSGKGCVSSMKNCGDNDDYTEDSCFGPDKGNSGCSHTPYVVTLTCGLPEDATPGTSCVVLGAIDVSGAIAPQIAQDVLVMPAKNLCAVLNQGATLITNAGMKDITGGVEWIGGTYVKVVESKTNKKLTGQLGGISYWNAIDVVYGAGDIPLCALK